MTPESPKTPQVKSRAPVGSTALLGGWRRLSEPPETASFFWFRPHPGWDTIMVRVYRDPENGPWLLDNPFGHGGYEYLDKFTSDPLCEFCGPIPRPPERGAIRWPAENLNL